MFDPRRNLLTTLLGGALVVLVCVGIAQSFWLGRVDVDGIAPQAGEAWAEGELKTPETGLDDIDRFAVITDRPLFFSDRRLPVVEVDSLEEDEALLAEQQAAEEIGELRARVAGIIITPDMRMALVRDEVANKTHVMREGMAFEGEQADWRLMTLTPRTANFRATDGKEAELELKVYTSELTVAASSAPAREPRRPARNGRAEEGAAEAPQVDDEARARAEEVRRRVAERRAQLREEAERRQQQQQTQDRGNNPQ